MSESTAKLARIDLLDVARGVALVAMAIYHFAWDLEFFGYADPGMTAHGGWKLFARSIASSFLLLVGFSLVLAHGRGVRWNGFWKRFAMVATAAAAISVTTYFAVPNGFIFFGILHQIAVGSLLGLLFLRMPPLLTAALAVAVIAAPYVLRAPIFDHPWLWWLGLAPTNPRSNDYVPIFPWLGAILIGIAAGGLFRGSRLSRSLQGWQLGNWARPLRFAGRHSLAFYLLHQPILIGCVWLFAQVWPAPAIPDRVGFSRSCEASCGEARDASFCANYCACMLDRIETADMLDDVFAGKNDDALKSSLSGFAAQCTAEIDGLESSEP